MIVARSAATRGPGPRRVVLPPRSEPSGPSRLIRRVGFLSTLAVLLVLVPALVGIGARALTRSSDGKRVGSAVSDPTAPGYEAVVTPTDTMLVMLAAPDGELSGAAMIAAAGASGGGTVLLVPAQLEVATDSPRPAPWPTSPEPTASSAPRRRWRGSSSWASDPQWCSMKRRG